MNQHQFNSHMMGLQLARMRGERLTEECGGRHVVETVETKGSRTRVRLPENLSQLPVVLRFRLKRA
jgi:hypothetical protein